MNRAIVEVRNSTRETERHSHTYHQVLLPYSGCLEIEVEGRGGRVAGNIAAFAAAGCDHSCSAKASDTFVVLNVPADDKHSSFNKALPPAFFSIGPEVRGLLDYMVTLGRRDELPAPLLAAWLSLILHRLTGNTPPPDRIEIGLQRAMAFMKRSFAQTIRVTDIAEAAGMSLTGRHAAFQQRWSTTPYAQLATLRLDAAERLLADPRLSIAEIALRTGHTDQSALTRAMRRERDRTPADVRRRLLRSLGGDA